MNVAAIISEYNPFHKGHAYQIEKTRQQYHADYVIAVMSGHFVQRGEPAIFDKWTRTQLALTGGADLVIELPTPIATASAELFSHGAVDLVNKLGVVDLLSFGSELGDLSELQSLAQFLSDESYSYQMYLNQHLQAGNSFPKARMLALENTYPGDISFIKGSNNILALEYLKALNRLQSTVTPVTIQRVGSSYLDEAIQNAMPSASAIRKAISQPSFQYNDIAHAFPKEVFELLTHLSPQQIQPVLRDQLFPYYQYLFKALPNTYLESIFDLSSDLLNRIRSIILQNVSYSDLMDQLTAKNFTTTTIQRAMIHTYLSIHQQDIDTIRQQDWNQYIRVLGFKKSSASLLNAIKKSTQLPIINNIKDQLKTTTPLGQQMLLQEVKYSNLYFQLSTQAHNYHQKNDYTVPIVIL